MLWGKRPQTTPEQRFWEWFQSNEAALFDFEKDQERVFKQLLAQLRKVNPDLVFEFGPNNNGRREFVISAGGIRAAFPAVESLYAAAPALPRWEFIKFRPRRAAMDISYAGISVKATSVLVKITSLGAKADIILYFPEYSRASHNAHMGIAFLFLDHALGEYDVETRVGKIDVRPLSDAPADSCTLEKLPVIFDNLLTKN